MTSVAAPTIKKMSPQFLVANLDQSLAFYVSNLGFDIDFRYEDFYAGVIKDGCSIHLKQGNPNIAERKSKRENGDLDIVFSVAGVDALYHSFVDAGIEITQSLCDQPYGKEFYIADPDSYILAFLEEA